MSTKSSSSKLSRRSRASSVSSRSSAVSTGSRRQNKSRHLSFRVPKKKILQPQPIIRDSLVRALQRDGANHNKQSTALLRVLKTDYDRFEAAVLLNLFDVSRPFPLPSPSLAGFSSPSSLFISSLPDGIVPGTGALPFGNTEARGTTVNGASIDGAVALGRYDRFFGRSTNTLSVSVPANGAVEVWFCHDPTNLINPVIAFTPGTANYTTISRLGSFGWSSDPYPFSEVYVNEAGDNPCTAIENTNIYYTGGVMLQVEHLNPSAYLTVAYQTRTGLNENERFVGTLPDLWATADPAYPLALRDLPTAARGAMCLYTGSQWHLGTKVSDSATTEGALQFFYSAYFRRCWSMGAPWVRAIVRNANTSDQPTDVQFAITLLSWNATAPVSQSISGAMPYQTVPATIPAYVRQLRTRGSVYTAVNGGLVDTTMTMLSRVPPSIFGGNSKVSDLMANNSSALRQAAIDAIQPRTIPNPQFKADMGVGTQWNYNRSYPPEFAQTVTTHVPTDSRSDHEPLFGHTVTDVVSALTGGVVDLNDPIASIKRGTSLAQSLLPIAASLL